MLDSRLRTLTRRALDPIAAGPVGRIDPAALTVGGGLVGLGAAGAAALGAWPLAVAAWLVNRFVDGLDGAVARRRGRASDAGGYLDMTVDVVVYAAVPLGIAVGRDDSATWAAAAVLLASFYVNTITWAYLSALLEKRGRGAADGGESTSVTMPVGLVEGAETVVFFTLFLAWPAGTPVTFSVMAALVAVGAVARFVVARHRLLRADAPEWAPPARSDELV